VSARVEIRRLSKRFGGRAALRDVSLVLEPGTTTTLVGPSGAGKTTLLRCLAGLSAQDSGEILFDGAPVGGLPAERRGVGFVFQSYALFPHLTVADNLAFGLDVRRVPRLERDARVSEVAASLGLDSLRDRRPAEISGGERQRVALGRAIAYRPALLLLDEPLAALDPNLASSVRDVLQTAIRNERTTVLVVTHDRADALRLGEQVALMREGRIEQIGSPSALYRTPASGFVASFFGAGTLWRLAAFQNGRGREVETPLGRVSIPSGPPGPVSLLIRPEAIRPADPTQGAIVRVAEAYYEGDRYRLRVVYEGGEATLEWPPDRTISPGDSIRVRLESSLVVLLPEALD
jgi:putative spermidine/putrescine transport system ATP-binding protein